MSDTGENSASLVSYYFDEHMDRDVARGLEKRGVNVVMPADVGMRQKEDDTEHLPYATEHGLVMVTFDHPFAGRTMERTDYIGLICLSPYLIGNIGRQIELLWEFAQLFDAEKDTAKVTWLR